MNNNEVRIIVEDGIDITFHFSDIIALRYGKAGFYAFVLLGNQKVKIPVTYKSFKDAAQYIGENVRHCKICAHRLDKRDTFVEDVLVETKWECPKCKDHEN